MITCPLSNLKQSVFVKQSSGTANVVCSEMTDNVQPQFYTIVMTRWLNDIL